MLSLWQFLGSITGLEYIGHSVALSPLPLRCLHTELYSQALSRGNWPRHSLYALAQYYKYIEDLILFKTLFYSASKKATAGTFHLMAA